MSQTLDITTEDEGVTLDNNKWLADALAQVENPSRLDSLLEFMDDCESVDLVGFCYNADIPDCGPEDAIVEKVYNSYDAIIRDRCGHTDFESMFAAREQVESLPLIDVVFIGCMPGRGEAYTNVSVIDDGAGQKHSDFKDQFLNPRATGVEKRGLSGSQGQHGVGSLAALEHSYQGTQLILSSASGEWTWTIIREMDADAKFDYGYYTIDGELPSFDGEPIFPQHIDGLSSGTMIRNFDFRLDGSKYGGIPRSMFSQASTRRFRYVVPSTIFPFNIWETRGTKYKSYLFEGVKWVVEEEYADIIETTVADTLTVDSQNLSGVLDIWAIVPKPEWEREELAADGVIDGSEVNTVTPLMGQPTDPRVFFTQNGQTHATKKKAFVDDAGLDAMSRDIFIIIECVGLDQEQAKIFRTDRTNLKETPIACELQSIVQSYLESNDTLQSLNAEREYQEKLTAESAPTQMHFETQESITVEKKEAFNLSVQIDTNSVYFEERCSIRSPSDKFDVESVVTDTGDDTITVRFEQTRETIIGDNLLKIELIDEHTDTTVSSSLLEVTITPPTEVQQQSTSTDVATTNTTTSVPNTTTSTSSACDTSSGDSFETPLFADAESPFVRMLLKYSFTTEYELVQSEMCMNRANGQGDGFENLCFSLFANEDGVVDTLHYSEAHPPDLPLANGPMSEAKKVQSTEFPALEMNSSYPKRKITPDSNKISEKLADQLADSETPKRDHLYLIGHMNETTLSHMWAVFGDVFVPSEQTLWHKIAPKLEESITSILNTFDINDTSNELFSLSDIGPLDNLRVRGRLMYSIDHPGSHLHKEIPQYDTLVQDDQPLFAVMRQDKYNSLSESDKNLLDDSDCMLIETTGTDPNNSNETIEIMLIVVT